MVDEVILEKAQTIERCLQRIKEEYSGNEHELKNNFTKQDSIILNLQRACEASVDMARRIISIKKIGLPQSYRDVFILLEKANIIDAILSEKMQKMVGFRNIAIHNYQEIELDILQKILENHLTDFQTLITVVLKLNY